MLRARQHRLSSGLPLQRTDATASVSNETRNRSSTTPNARSVRTTRRRYDFARPVGSVALINGRGQPSLLREIEEAGLHLNEGMVVKMGGRFSHGGDCWNVLALLIIRLRGDA
jgi:hypothetical protein